MNTALLAKLLGTDGNWNGPCTVILDADAHVQPTGSDSIVQGGLKSFAPRLITGRVPADAVSLMADQSALLLVQTLTIRQSTGDDIVRQTLLVVDTAHVAAIEFTDLAALARLGVQPPK